MNVVESDRKNRINLIIGTSTRYAANECAVHFIFAWPVNDKGLTGCMSNLINPVIILIIYRYKSHIDAKTWALNICVLAKRSKANNLLAHRNLNHPHPKILYYHKLYYSIFRPIMLSSFLSHSRRLNLRE